jgi:virginiamycin B lyase
MLPPVQANMAMKRKLALLAVCLLSSSAILASEPVPATVFPARVTEWSLPKPMFARSSAIAPDGRIYIAVPNDNKVLRFDPETQSFKDWDLPNGHQPNSVMVDRRGMVWTTGYGNGTIGKLKPSTGAIAEFATPSGSGGRPHTLALGPDGETLWFTLQTGNSIGSVDILTGRIAEYETSGNPTGIAIDRSGSTWWCRSGDDKLGRLDPRTGKISELDMGRGSRPRRIASAPDGMLWVTLYGNGRLAKVDPAANRIIDTYPLPGGNAGAYAVAVDNAGIVWANQIRTDAVARLDPANATMQIIRLPSSNIGIRKLTTDGNRLWYTGSHNGRLGLIEYE